LSHFYGLERGKGTSDIIFTSRESQTKRVCAPWQPEQSALQAWRQEHGTPATEVTLHSQETDYLLAVLQRIVNGLYFDYQNDGRGISLFIKSTEQTG
jgi:hypothetical protein